MWRHFLDTPTHTNSHYASVWGHAAELRRAIWKSHSPCRYDRHSLPRRSCGPVAPSEPQPQPNVARRCWLCVVERRRLMRDVVACVVRSLPSMPSRSRIPSDSISGERRDGMTQRDRQACVHRDRSTSNLPMPQGPYERSRAQSKRRGGSVPRGRPLTSCAAPLLHLLLTRVHRGRRNRSR